MASLAEEIARLRMEQSVDTRKFRPDPMAVQIQQSMPPSPLTKEYWNAMNQMAEQYIQKWEPAPPESPYGSITAPRIATMPIGDAISNLMQVYRPSGIPVGPAFGLGSVFLTGRKSKIFNSLPKQNIGGVEKGILFEPIELNMNRFMQSDSMRKDGSIGTIYDVKNERLPDIISNRLLFESYPSVKKTKVSININERLPYSSAKTILSKTPFITVEAISAEEASIKLNHEIQHLIQNIEGKGVTAKYNVFDLFSREGLKKYNTDPIEIEAYNVSRPEYEEMMKDIISRIK